MIRFFGWFITDLTCVQHQTAYEKDINADISLELGDEIGDPPPPLPLVLTPTPPKPNPPLDI